jgi:hypothetical protein
MLGLQEGITMPTVFTSIIDYVIVIGNKVICPLVLAWNFKVMKLLFCLAIFVLSKSIELLGSSWGWGHCEKLKH